MKKKHCMSLDILPLAPEHLPRILEIEPQAHSHPWSETLLSDINSRGAFHHVLIKDQRVIGYFYAQNIVGEVTLLNIAIDPCFQGQGYGSKLLEAFLEFCQHREAESVWLEVRESNITASRLYQNLGFNEVDRRRDYYPTMNGKEDAIIMSYLFFPFH